MNNPTEPVLTGTTPVAGAAGENGSTPNVGAQKRSKKVLEAEYNLRARLSARHIARRQAIIDEMIAKYGLVSDGSHLAQPYDVMSVGAADEAATRGRQNAIRCLYQLGIGRSPNAPAFDGRETIAQLEARLVAHNAWSVVVDADVRVIRATVRAWMRPSAVAERRQQQATLEAEIKEVVDGRRARRITKRANDADHRAMQLIAMGEGQMEDVDDAILRKSLDFPSNSRIVEKSSEHRCILTVVRKYKSGDVGPAYLLGIDDNGDVWRHELTHARYAPSEHEGYGELDETIETAMAWLFRTTKETVRCGLRQGDVMLAPGRHYTEGSPVRIPSGHILEGDAKEDGEGHVIVGPEGATLTHTSHEALQLVEGKYLIATNQIGGD